MLAAFGAVVLLAATSVITSATPGAAQAAFVQVSVHVSPPLPQPGQTVTVTARVTGCPPGGTEVDVLMVANELEGVTGALMYAQIAPTSLLWRTKAQITLPNAIQGWYGVRVQCGTFHPDEVPMPNTTFAVGAVPVTTMALSSSTVASGGTVTLSGTNCPGSSVDYEVVPRNHYGDPFAVTASIPTGPGGSWSGQIQITPDYVPGPALVRARCVTQNALGIATYISYGMPLDLRIAPPS